MDIVFFELSTTTFWSIFFLIWLENSFGQECPFDVHVMVYCLSCSPCFLALQDIPGLSSVFLASALDSVIFTRSPGFFYWRMDSDAKIWVWVHLGELSFYPRNFVWFFLISTVYFLFRFIFSFKYVFTIITASKNPYLLVLSSVAFICVCSCCLVFSHFDYGSYFLTSWRV